jgi:tetratricopeptide (TPR) repeat protein
MEQLRTSGSLAVSMHSCVSCGQSVSSDAPFCAVCGTGLSGRDVSPAAVDVLLKAHRALDLGSNADAIPQLESLCEIYPLWPSARISLGIAYLRVARVYESEDALTAAEALEPDSFACEVAWGEYHARLGFYDRALKRLNRALELTPPTLIAYTAAVELRRVCREKSRRLYYRKAVLPGFLSRFVRGGTQREHPPVELAGSISG